MGSRLCSDSSSHTHHHRKLDVNPQQNASILNTQWQRGRDFEDSSPFEYLGAFVFSAHACECRVGKTSYGFGKANRAFDLLPFLILALMLACPDLRKWGVLWGGVSSTGVHRPLRRHISAFRARAPNWHSRDGATPGSLPFGRLRENAAKLVRLPRHTLLSLIPIGMSLKAKSVEEGMETIDAVA